MNPAVIALRAMNRATAREIAAVTGLDLAQVYGDLVVAEAAGQARVVHDEITGERAWKACNRHVHTADQQAAFDREFAAYRAAHTTQEAPCQQRKTA
jgi:hypothetical protein